MIRDVPREPTTLGDAQKPAHHGVHVNLKPDLQPLLGSCYLAPKEATTQAYAQKATSQSVYVNPEPNQLDQNSRNQDCPNG